MGFDRPVFAPKNKEVAAKIVDEKKVKKEPSLKLMTKREIEENRIKSYDFAI
jgi:hypothetical protein